MQNNSIKMVTKLANASEGEIEDTEKQSVEAHSETIIRVPVILIQFLESKGDRYCAKFL